MTAPEGFPTTAATLRRLSEEILDRWEAGVRARRELPQGEPESWILRDDLPRLIDALAAGLESPPAAGVIADPTSYDHALQRFAEDVPLKALVEEYRVLRWALFEVVAREAPSELAGSWPIVAGHIDRAVEVAIARYSEQRSQWFEERERDLDALLDELPVGVAVADARARQIVRKNCEMVRLHAALETAREPEAMARGVERPDGAPLKAREAPLVRALAGEEVGPHELLVRGADGAAVSVETRARPLRRRGATRAAVAIAIDVSERTRARAARELFAATLGHDVRSPLSTIRVAAQRLEQMEGSDLVTKLSGGIARSAAVLTDLVGELLDLAKSFEQPLELRREPFDLAELATTLAADHRVAARGTAIRVDAPEPALGSWDRKRLTRVLHNLIGNAEKHGDAAAGIEVSVRREGALAVLAVSSRAAGDVAIDDRLFEPYHRGLGGAVGAGGGGGSGLGLYLVKLVAEAHGGRAEARRDGDVVTVRVFLPADDEGGDADPVV